MILYTATSPTESYTLSLHDALPILRPTAELEEPGAAYLSPESGEATEVAKMIAADLCARIAVLADLGLGYLSLDRTTTTDRKSTRLNSSHSQISYAVFCLKKKNE